MLLAYDSLLRDTGDNLYFHGAKVCLFGDVQLNGIKWGRGNAWMMLALNGFLIETRGNESLQPRRDQVSDILSLLLQSLLSYQRASGVFGNIIG